MTLVYVCSLFTLRSRHLFMHVKERQGLPWAPVRGYPLVVTFVRPQNALGSLLPYFPVYGYVKCDCSSSTSAVADACNQLDTFSNVGNVRHIMIDKDAFNCVGLVSGRKLFCRLRRPSLLMVLLSSLQIILWCVFFSSPKRFLYLSRLFKLTKSSSATVVRVGYGDPSRGSAKPTCDLAFPNCPVEQPTLVSVPEQNACTLVHQKNYIITISNM